MPMPMLPHINLQVPSIPPEWKVWLRTSYSLAAGAAAGVVEQVVIDAHMHINQVDWHQAGWTAGGTALVAVIMHWLKPPNTP